MAIKALDGGMGGGAVPSLNNFSVAPNVTPTARFSPNISLRQDETLKYAGKLLDTGLAIKNQLDDDEADDKAEKWMAYNSDRLQKYQQLSGENALKDSDGNDVFSNYYSDRNQYLGELTADMNARQLLRFRKQVASSDRAFDRGMNGHRFDSYKNVAFSRYDTAQTERAKMIYSAGLSQDFEAVATLLSETKQATKDHLKRWDGAPYDIIDKLAGYGNSKLIGGLIDQAFNEGNNDLGTKFLELYGGDLNAQDWSRLMGRAKEGAYSSFGRQMFDAISRGEKTFTFDIPQLGTSESGVGFSNAFINESATDKTPYSREAGKRSDCSSMIGKVIRGMGGVSAETKKLFTGTSDSIIKGLGEKYGFITKGGGAPSNVHAGMVISIDTGETRTGFDKNHWQGIDHIAVVIEKDGKPFIVDKTRGGTKVTEYGKWASHYKNARFFTVDASPAFGSTKKTETIDLSAFKGFDPRRASSQEFALIAETIPFFKQHPEAKKSFLSFGQLQGSVNSMREQEKRDAISLGIAKRRLTLDENNYQLSVAELKARQANNKDYMPSDTDFNEFHTMSNMDAANQFHRGAWLFMDDFNSFSKGFIAMRSGGKGLFHDVMMNEYNRVHSPKDFTNKIPPMNQTVRRAIYAELGVPWGKQLTEEQKQKFGDIAFSAYNYCKDKFKKPDGSFSTEDMVASVHKSQSMF